MAKGNIFILIHGDDLVGNPPVKTKDRYEWETYTYDIDGNITDTIINVPTWETLATRYEQTYGVLRNGVYNEDGETYYIIEFETSFIKGEVQQLLALSNIGNFPKYVILSAREAVVFLKDGILDEA